MKKWKIPGLFFDDVDTFISSKLEADPSCRFVFPSQVVADARLRRALQTGTVQALRKDRFWSWDTFKEKSFDESRAQRPVNGAVRLLFASALLEENSRSVPPLFRELVPELWAEFSRSYRTRITAILPRLEGFWKELESSGSQELFSPLLLEDFKLLRHRYSHFLEEQQLFEPGASISEPRFFPFHTYIFFPELVEDFPEYKGVLESCAAVTVVPSDELFLPPLQSTGSVSLLYRYGAAASELGDLLERLMMLLEEGEEPGEIAITLPDRTEWRERLAAEAANRGLLLHFRSGDPLSGSAPGRFFRHLQETLSGDWELKQVQQLFTDCAVPWKEKELLHQLALFGRDHFCHRSGLLWEKQLRRSGKGRLYDYFLKLRKGAGLLTDAPTFAALKERMQPFIQTFLDSDRWGEGDLPTLQRALDALKDLAEAEESCGFSDTGPVFPLWLSWLESKKYVRPQERRGISVYDYRVSAGLNVKYHFIPGCGQEKSRILLPRFPFLSEEERTALSGSDRDLSDSFLRVYGATGNGAVFSFSEKGFGGPDLPPTELIGMEVEGSLERRLDPFRLEPSCWQSGRFPGKLWPLQKQGLTNYLAAGGAGKRSDFTADAITSPHLREGLLKNLFATPSISPSLLTAFWSCPFAFLIDRALKARAPEVDIRFDDPRIIGTLFHKAAARFFEKSGDSAQKNMEEALAEVFSEWSLQSDPIPLPPVADAVQRSVSSGAMALSHQYPLVYGAYRTIGIEKELEADWNGKPLEIGNHPVALKLSGRCDWIGRNSTEPLVVDYKKRVWDKKRDIFPDDAESFPSSFQIAFYRYLLKECGYGTASAAWFDMTEGAFKTVCGDGKKPMLSPDEAEQLFSIVEEAVLEMLHCFEDGAFMVPQLRCEGCKVRGACRKRFHVRDVKDIQEKQWS